MEDKSKNNKRKELLSRRSFFRRISKSVLPVVGAVIFSNLPVPGNALVRESYNCKGNCDATCLWLCAIGCTNECLITCEVSCKYSCNDGCVSCSDVCKQDCQLCYNDNSSNNCRITSVSTDSLKTK